MTLKEIAAGYRDSVDRIQLRIEELTAVRDKSRSNYEMSQIDFCIKELKKVRRECREIAETCEKYYEKGYRRNGKYTV